MRGHGARAASNYRTARRIRSPVRTLARAQPSGVMVAKPAWLEHRITMREFMLRTGERVILSGGAAIDPDAIDPDAAHD